jgi:hypothetical protein
MCKVTKVTNEKKNHNRRDVSKKEDWIFDMSFYLAVGAATLQFIIETPVNFKTWYISS